MLTCWTVRYRSANTQRDDVDVKSARRRHATVRVHVPLRLSTNSSASATLRLVPERPEAECNAFSEAQDQRDRTRSSRHLALNTHLQPSVAQRLRYAYYI